MKWIARWFALQMSAAGAILPSTPSQAADFPSQPVTFVVGNAAGGGSDIVARLIADKIKDRLRQAVLVVNKPGAEGIIAYDFVAHAAPDGYTLMVSTTGLPGAPFTLKSFTLDPVRDFTHIIELVEFPFFLGINADIPANTVADLIAYAKAHPGKLNFGTAGASNTMENVMFMEAAGIKMTNVTYKGGGPTQTALLANEIQALLSSLRVFKAGADAGKLRILGVAALKRSGLAPDVPTVAESGSLPGYTAAAVWYGLSGPAGIPRDVVARLNQAVNEALRLPEVKARMQQIGFEISGGSSDDFRESVAATTAHYRKAAQLSGVKPE